MNGYDMHKEYQRPYEYYLRHSPRAYVADLAQLDDVSILEQIIENYKPITTNKVELGITQL